MALLGSLFKRFTRARQPDLPCAPVSAPARPGAAPSRTPPAMAPAREAPGPGRDDVDRRFTALLLGAGPLRRADADPAERRIIEQLAELARSGRDSNLVPRLPAVLPRLIGLVRRDDVAPRELAERLSRDPALVGEVVRLANSPRYRTGRDVADLQEAVIVLGQHGLIQLVTRAAMRPIFNAQQGRFSRIAGTRLWDLSDRCAHACAQLCGGADRFQAYLAGMVANAGLIVALRVLDAGYQESRAPDSEDFHRALGDVTSMLSERIARHWNFHPDVCRAVGRRAGSRAGEADDDLTRALRTADRISKWHLLMPGLAVDALAGLTDAERGCYAELERTFGG